MPGRLMNPLPSRAASPRSVVLIVDEYDETRFTNALSLSAMGFDVVAARDDTEAYKRALAVHPDIIVTRLASPESERWQLLHTLNQDRRTSGIRVVAMSAHAHAVLKERAKHDGIPVVFVKPCLADELAAVLRWVLDRDHRQPARP